MHGLPDKFGSIVDEFGTRGIETWEDAGLRSLADLKRTGLHEGQLALLQWELRRRGSRLAPPVG